MNRTPRVARCNYASAVLLGVFLCVPVGCTSSNEVASVDGVDPVERTNGTSAQALAAASPITSGFAGKCLDDSSDRTTNGNKIDLWACNGTAAQNWTYTGGTFVGPGGKCIDVTGNRQVAGTVGDLYQCNATSAQQWTVSGASIKSAGGLCLDVEGSVNTNGAKLVLATCNGSSESQLWHTSAAPPPTQPSLRQYAVEQTNGGAGVYEVNSVKTFAQPTQKANAIWVAATIPNDGSQNNVSVVDSQGNTFTSIGVEHDTGNGAQTVWQFYAANIKGDQGTADAVTVKWGNDNYKGVLIAEIAGVTASPLVGHSVNLQAGDAPGANDGVTSNGIVVSAAQTPALLLALSMDTFGGTSDLGPNQGGDGQSGPKFGTGFTAETTLWNFDPGLTCAGIACNLASFETKSITAAGTDAATFTARAPAGSPHPGDYATVAVVFH